MFFREFLFDERRYACLKLSLICFASVSLQTAHPGIDVYFTMTKHVSQTAYDIVSPSYSTIVNFFFTSMCGWDCECKALLAIEEKRKVLYKLTIYHFTFKFLTDSLNLVDIFRLKFFIGISFSCIKLSMHASSSYCCTLNSCESTGVFWVMQFLYCITLLA